MAKKEKLNEEAAMNNNLDPSTYGHDVEFSEELQDRKIQNEVKPDRKVEKDINPKRIKRS